MHGLSYSRSDKVICCSFLTVDAIKFVHCVNRLERPLPSDYFGYHRSSLCFSAVKCTSLHDGNGSVSAETFLPFCCCVIKCLYRNILDCSYFQCFCYLLFPQLWQILGQAIMLWSYFLFTESLLNLPVTSFRLILGKESHGLSSELCLRWYFFKSHGAKRLVLQRAEWRPPSVELHSCCQACSPVEGVINESTCEPIVHEPSEAVPAASWWMRWTTNPMLYERQSQFWTYRGAHLVTWQNLLFPRIDHWDGNVPWGIKIIPSNVVF